MATRSRSHRSFGFPTLGLMLCTMLCLFVFSGCKHSSHGGSSSGTYTVGGTVTGLNGTVVLKNNGSDSLTVTANGAFSFHGALSGGSAYSVTVYSQPVGQTCNATNGSGVIGSTNVVSVAITCTNITYKVGGAVSGLSGTVVLRDNGADDLTITANGAFQFATALAAGAGYAVTVVAQPYGQTCTVSNGSGTIASTDITNVSITCSTSTPVGLIPGDPTQSLGSSPGVVGSVPVLDSTHVSCDASQNCTVRDALTVQFADGTQIGQANALLTSLGATVVSMTPGSTFVALHISDPGSLSAYMAIISQLQANPLIVVAEPVTIPEAATLPSSYTTADPKLDYLLAVRQAAAWSLWQARGPKNPHPPTIFIADLFAGNPPVSGAFSLNFIPGGAYKIGLTSNTPAQSSCLSTTPTHGWTVLSAVAASFNGAAPAATGLEPIGLNVIVWNYCRYAPTYAQIVSELSNAAQSGPIIVSSSIYARGSSNTTLASSASVQAQAGDWLKALRGTTIQTPSGLETSNNFWVYAAAGNNRAVSGAQSSLNTPFAYAAEVGLSGAAPMTNETTVGSTDVSAPASLAPLPATAPSSFSAPFTSASTGMYAVAGSISPSNCTSNAGAVWAFIDSGTSTSCEAGTSFATPQVAGLAAFLSAMSDGSLTLKDINQRILDTANATGNSIPVIDSYAALMTLDSNASSAARAPFRTSLLATASGDTDFDETALTDIVQHLVSGAGKLDYSRYDLNGDGYTGGTTTAPLDLDASYQAGTPSSLYSTVLETLNGQVVDFDETNLTDAQVACYYAYSPLFKQKSASDQRSTILAPIAATCGLLAPIFARGINSARTIVGGSCPSGHYYIGDFECDYGSSSGPVGDVLTGILYPLSKLAKLTPCGFIASSDTQALAVAENGSVIIEGRQAEPNNNTGQITCLLTPANPLNDGTPQFTASALSFFAMSINTAGTIVGGLCPSGHYYIGKFECDYNSPSGPSAVALIKGQTQPLSSLVSFAPCGFSSSDSQAIAISEKGWILVEGRQAEPNNNTGLIVCLLKLSTSGSNTTPQYTASALSFFGHGVNSAGTIVGGACPSGHYYIGDFECDYGSPSGPAAVAAIGGGFYVLANIANLAPCGFMNSSDTQALAVSENGSILVEGRQAESNNNTGNIVCLLTPATALPNGTPQFTAQAL